MGGEGKWWNNVTQAQLEINAAKTLKATRRLACGIINHSDRTARDYLNEVEQKGRVSADRDGEDVGDDFSWDSLFGGGPKAPTASDFENLAFNFDEWMYVDFAQAMAMYHKGLLRFDFHDPKAPAAAAAETYSAEYKKGTKGPCWDGYTYVGDTPYSKGSCVKNAETYRVEGRPPKQAKGLVVDDSNMAAQIRSGQKTMVVWNKPLDIARKRFILLSNRKAYAYIEVGAMEEITLPKFRKLEGQHRISGSERSRLWKGHKRLYAWPVKVLKKFDRLYSTNAPLRPQKVVPRVKTYSAESMLSKPKNAAQRAIYQAVKGARMRENLKKQEIIRKIKELQEELESAMQNSVRVF